MVTTERKDPFRLSYQKIRRYYMYTNKKNEKVSLHLSKDDVLFIEKGDEMFKTCFYMISSNAGNAARINGKKFKSYLPVNRLLAVITEDVIYESNEDNKMKSMKKLYDEGMYFILFFIIKDTAYFVYNNYYMTKPLILKSLEKERHLYFALAVSLLGNHNMDVQDKIKKIIIRETY